MKGQLHLWEMKLGFEALLEGVPVHCSLLSTEETKCVCIWEHRAAVDLGVIPGGVKSGEL